MADIQNIVGILFSLQLFAFSSSLIKDSHQFSHNNLVEELDANVDFLSKTFVQHNSKEETKEIFMKHQVGIKNLNKDLSNLKLLGDGEVIDFIPGAIAPSFSLWDVEQKISYSNEKWGKLNISLIIHVLDPDSGFLECMWNSDEGLMPLLNETIPNNHFIFIPKRATINETYGALWMKNRIVHLLNSKNSQHGRHTSEYQTIMNRMHFSVEPVSKLGNWIPSLLQQWQCVDHLCGLDQVVVQIEGQKYPIILKRLDARYDWLPNPSTVFLNKTIPVTKVGTGCQRTPSANQTIAVVTSDGCSYYQKVSMMEKSGAVGVIVIASKDQIVQEMNCNGTECQSQLSIPATFVEYSVVFQMPGKMNVTFQNTPTSNFFAAIDRAGFLAEVGWFLYPSMNFLVWQAQWFDYKYNLEKALSSSEMVIEIFKDKVMQGNNGVVVNVTLPDVTDLRLFSKMELDMSLSCPGTRDTTCGHWDHTVNLYVCCDSKSPLCGMELGRWITSFRRRIGRWLTDVTPLMPLLTSNTCTFTMKTAPWAQPWIPSLNIRFSKSQDIVTDYPGHINPLYYPGASFDKTYNSHFLPTVFPVPNNITKMKIFSVITGHGSDENGCGEFCVTSHHLEVNGNENNITFSTAGSPFGCADLVHTGVEPNEHGTWLYGRNGWCDGRNVFPWVIDITHQVKPDGYNFVKYHGYFNGTDPNPKQNPGVIYIYSYLVYYYKVSN